MIDFNALAVIWTNNCRLLAGQAQYIHMGRRFRRGGSGLDWTDLFFPVVVFAAVLGFVWLVSSYLKFREKRKADSPKALFAELCRAHRLDWSSQQLLLALASANRLASPAQIFVEPERFQAERLGEAFVNRSGKVAALHSKLFAATERDELDAS